MRSFGKRASLKVAGEVLWDLECGDLFPLSFLCGSPHSTSREFRVHFCWRISIPTLAGWWSAETLPEWGSGSGHRPAAFFLVPMLSRVREVPPIAVRNRV